MRALTPLLSACVLGIAAVALGADPGGSVPTDFAYRMQVNETPGSAAYRVTVPLALYEKIVHPELSDLRVFNGNAEQVPFAIERPASATVTNAATALSVFPLQDDSSATLDALRITIESGRGSVNVQAGGQAAPNGKVNGPAIRTYLVDGRSFELPAAALRLDWPQDAADFAGRVRVEASDNLGDWRSVAGSAPVANLHSGAGRLVEQRVEFSPTKARYWRLSWVGSTAPFVLTAVLAEPATQNVEARHVSRDISAIQTKTPGEFAYDLGGRLPIDRVNLLLPDTNTVVDVELLSRVSTTEPWRIVRRCGFYRLKSDGEELRNGPVAVALNTDRYWLLRTNPKSGGLGAIAPNLVVEWVPHEVVFVARGPEPFYLAYGSATADSAAVSLAVLPKSVSIASASLSEPERLGGDDRLSPAPEPYAWKTAFLWVVLIAGAALLAWMVFRLSKDFSRT
ncbi:MAG: DUF3999 domain-containing protein [Steroidobacteraceae bacterium]